MQDITGSRLGPYEIVAPLGAGGMGEVYRARDPRLKREVAIKILPETMWDPERQKRFQREAQTASSLNHPNILVVYDIGAEDGRNYIVSELVEGESLRKLVQAGPIPTRKFLDLAVQIADGLAAAHQAGIVHRDLKPENIMVTREGHVKILDFGLAKWTSLESVDRTSETVPHSLTKEGIIQGTVPYMSPEQAKGNAVDFRSDQFSFGSILYEMATGKRPFQRESAPQILSAIISEEATPIMEVNPRLPAPVRWLIERCLAKEPQHRYDSTRDLYRDLGSVRDHLSEAILSESQGTVPRPTVSMRKKIYRLALTGTLLIALGVAFFAMKTDSFFTKKEIEKSLPTFQRLTFRRGAIYSARFAADGNTIVYSAAWDGKPSEIYAGIPGSPEHRSLGLSDAAVLSISRSGEMAVLLRCRYVSPSLGVIGTLARIPFSGGAPRELIEDVFSADWSPDGKELAAVRQIGNTFRLEFPLGKVLYETPNPLRDVRVSPKGDRVGFLEFWRKGTQDFAVVTLDRAGKKQVLSEGWDSGWGLAWLPSGNELFFGASKSSLTAKDLHAVTLAGNERLILPFSNDLRFQDISQDGRMLVILNNERAQMNFFQSGETVERDLSWFDWSLILDVSQDGKTALFNEVGEATGVPRDTIYIRKTDGSPAVRLGEGLPFKLSPDGNWVLATGSFGTPFYYKQLVMVPTGAGESRVLARGPIEEYGDGMSWFPDGKRIAFTGKEKNHNFKIYVQEVDAAFPRAITPEGTQLPLLCPTSPDGKFLVGAGEDEKLRIYPVAGGESRLIAGLDKESHVVGWTTDGKELYVASGAQPPVRIYLLNPQTGKKTLWKELVPSDPAGVSIIFNPRITPDGKSYAYTYERTLSDLFLLKY